MPSRLWCVLMILLWAVPLAASAEQAGGAAAAGESGSHEQHIQAAPGGGDMIILRPESQYVIHGSTDAGGHLHVGCARDGGAAQPSSATPPVSAWPGAR